MRPIIQIKGIREGLLITLGEGKWDKAHQALLTHLDQQAEFLRGARLALDVGNHILKAAEMGNLRSEISERGISLWAVLSNSPTTESTAQTLGLATRLSKPTTDKSMQKIDTTLHEGEEGILVHRTLRSGYSLTYPGHVTVLGDINPGAEVIASGNILVWGRLRGLVHAGAEGDRGALVCALDLSPIQLRIAGQIARLEKRRSKSQPEMARLQDDEVILEAWKTKKGK
jgi:septum site-determining protein MinC